MPRGGKRKGAGRPPGAEPRIKKQLTLHPLHVRMIADVAADRACSESEAARLMLARGYLVLTGTQP